MTSTVIIRLPGLAEAIYKEKSSKFLAYAYPVESEGGDSHAARCAAQEILRRDAPLLRVALGPHGETFRANDDGEPSGTAGKPILGQLLSNELVNCLIVVVRYFGGTKLGVSGLIGATRSRRPKRSERAKIVERTVDKVVEVEIFVPGDERRDARGQGRTAPVLTQQFDNLCRMTLAIRQSLAGGMIGKLEKIGGRDPRNEIISVRPEHAHGAGTGST